MCVYFLSNPFDPFQEQTCDRTETEDMIHNLLLCAACAAIQIAPPRDAQMHARFHFFHLNCKRCWCCYVQRTLVPTHFRFARYQKAIHLWGLLQWHHSVEILQFVLDIRYHRQSYHLYYTGSSFRQDNIWILMLYLLSFMSADKEYLHKTTEGNVFLHNAETKEESLYLSNSTFVIYIYFHIFIHIFCNNTHNFVTAE